jgi:hypothetical protein
MLSALAAFVLGIALTGSVRADADAAAQAEIDHLLNFVAASPCTFIRNGDPHPGPEARDHLAGKYGWAKSRITTAEEFIRYIGTESSMSAEPYRVRCGTTEMPAGVWLTDELRRFRKTRPPAK